MTQRSKSASPSTRAISRLGKLVGIAGLSGLATLAYGGLIEARWFRVRHQSLPLLAADAEPIRLVQISDLHLVKSNRKKIEFTRSLAQLNPDVVINTGDNLGAEGVLDELFYALEPLFEFPGVFVPGSNDFYGPKRSNPLKYFAGPSSKDSEEYHRDRAELEWRDMFSRFKKAGWVSLTNKQHRSTVNGSQILWAGTGDAHLDQDRYPGFPEVEDDSAVRIGLTHAPYQRVLNKFAADGADLVFAGHTHGGQIALPFYGALVTNCDLPTRYASGLFRWPESSDEPAHAKAHSASRTYVNVSAGIGSSPTLPVRIACRPEAVVIDLVPGTAS